MAITFTITAAGGVKIPQSDIATTKNVNLSIASVTDTINVADSGDITKYDFDWYFIDKPNNTSSINTELTADNETVSLNSIDTWGSYRIFVIARHKETNTKSEENPLKAPEESFITLSVESTSNSLEKPANFERNWKEKYDKLVDVVDSSTKRVNVLKVSNTVSFTLPVTDGTDGQMLTTDGSGQLQFVDLDLTNMENNISLNALTDVNVVNATPDQVLKWNGSEWIPGTSAGISGLTSDEVNDTLTITNGYSLLKESLAEGEVDPGLNHIGSLEEPFDELHIKSINGSLLIGETGRKLLPEILGASGEFLKYLPTGDFGTAFIQMSDVQDLNDELNEKLEYSDLYLSVFSDESSNNFLQIADGYTLVPENNATSIVAGNDIGSSEKNFQNIFARRLFCSTIADDPQASAPSVLSIDKNAKITSQIADQITFEIEARTDLNQTEDILAITGKQMTPGAPRRRLSVDSDGVFSLGDKTINSPTHYAFPTSRGTAGQILVLNSSANALEFDDASISGGSKIEEGNTLVETNDSGADGHIVLQTEGSQRWHVTSGGHIIPQANAAYDLGNAEYKVRHLFLSDNSMYIGDFAKLSTSLPSNNNPVGVQLNMTPGSFNQNGEWSDAFEGYSKTIFAFNTANITPGTKYNVLYDEGAVPSAGFVLAEASDGGETDKIEEGNTLVETIDTGTDGHIVLQTEGSQRWHVTSGGHIIPQTNAAYDLGNAENKVRHLFLSDNSLYFGDQEEIPTTATISRSNDPQIMGAYASSKFSIETTKAGFLSTNKTLLTATEPDPILNGTQYAMTFSDGGPVPGWSLEPVEIESSNFTPAYLSVHLTQQNNPLETSKFRNPFNTHNSVGANKATSVNAVSITGQTNGRFTLANPGIYEVTIVLVVNDSNSSTSFKTFTVQVRKNTSFSTNGDPDIDETSGTAITALTTYARHGSVDPVERTVNFIMQTSSQNEYIDILMQGSTQFIALDAGTSISIKRIA